MLNKQQGKVVRIISAGPDIQEVVVDIGGRESKAINYIDLSGCVNIGDDVLLNTTAVDLKLGTGGVHFVICNLSNPVQNVAHEPGHIMKLRYTPMQCSVLSVEEDDSPYHESMEGTQSLDGIIVVCCELLSQTAPVAAAIKSIAGYDKKVAFIMTDGAALPVSFSHLIRKLKDASIIDSVITCGQSFGGDIEAINVYTGLLAAKSVVEADVAIVSQGPGNAGTGTRYGFSGIQQGEALNAASALGGRPIAAVRMSFADQRERHRGISHHSLTILEKIALSDITVALPELFGEKADIIKAQIAGTQKSTCHRFITADGQPGLDELHRKQIRVTTMGRSIDQDLEFFLSASAAGTVAAGMLDL